MDKAQTNYRNLEFDIFSDALAVRYQGLMPGTIANIRDVLKLLNAHQQPTSIVLSKMDSICRFIVKYSSVEIEQVSYFWTSVKEEWPAIYDYYKGSNTVEKPICGSFNMERIEQIVSDMVDSKLNSLAAEDEARDAAMLTEIQRLNTRVAELEKWTTHNGPDNK